MSPRIPWPRILAEGFAIIVSILLAFGIQAWWEGSQERADERASLELLRRDLAETLDQLATFDEVMDEVVSAATFALSAMSDADRGLDPARVSAAIVTAGGRRTVRVNSAAYLDLLNTGSLRLIENRSLRDEIVRFYEDAQRVQNVISANNSAIDDLVHREIFGTGLVFNHLLGQSSTMTRDGALEPVAEALGAAFVLPPDRLWSLPQSSPEWSRVEGTMLQIAIGAAFSRSDAVQVMQGARELSAAVEAELEARW